MTGIAHAEGGGDFGVLVNQVAIGEHALKAADFLLSRFGRTEFVLANLGEEGTYFKAELLQILGPLGAAVASTSFDIRNVGPGEGAHLIRPVGSSNFDITDRHLVLAQGRVITGGTARFATNHALADRAGVHGAKSVTVVSLIGSGEVSDLAGIDVGGKPIAGYGIPPLPKQNRANPGLAAYTYYPEIYTPVSRLPDC